MATIRHEINILCASYTGTGTVSSNEIVQLDTNQYYGTVTYYFEAVYSGAASNTGNVRLTRSGTTTDDATVSGATSSTVILTRSTAFTPPSGQTQYIVRLVGDGTRSQTVKAARIVIIQSDPVILKTQTQIEIGSASTITATSIPTGTTNATNPKYWLYTAANWSSVGSVFFEATFANPASSKSSATVELQMDDGSFGATWTNVVAITTSSTTATRVRSSGISLTDGRHYRIVGSSSSSKTGMVIYNAKIILTCGLTTFTTDQNQNISSDTSPVYGGSGTHEKFAQSFTPTDERYLGRFDLALSSVGSPADSLTVELRDALDGNILASFAPSVTSTPSVVTFNLSEPIWVSSNPYFIQVSRTGARDTSNYYNVSGDSTSDNYSGGSAFESDSASWVSATNASAGTFYDAYFLTTVSSQLGPTNLELQYLLANTLFTAGTALQTFLTKWDSTEWATTTGLPTFKHDVEAGAATTSTIELDTASGTQLTGSVVTNPSSEGTSGAVTMPANGNLDVKATTNGGNLTASRILAIVNLGAPIPLSLSVRQAVKRAAFF